MFVRLLALLAALVAAAGCRAETPIGDQRLGGRRVPGPVLTQGRAVYASRCARCHGDDGAGRTAEMMRVDVPRDLRIGLYKFTSVLDGALPCDEDLLRTLRRGLPGTRMPAFPGLSDADARAVVAYLKTLAPRWRTEESGTPWRAPPDPWGADPSAGADRGRVVYHQVARCWTCHPAYVTASELAAMAPEGTQPIELRADPRRPLRVPTPYGSLRSTDLRRDTLHGGSTPADILRSVGVGIPGSGMPSWADSLSPRDLWALVHYIQELRSL